MSLLLLIPLSIGLGLIGLYAFSWALKSGQFDDLDGAAWRVILSNDPPQTEGKPDDHLAPDTEDGNARRRL